MKLLFSKRFIKSLKKQPKKIQNETKLRLQLFLKDPFHILLKRHALKGKLQNFESINVSGDIRIIFYCVSDTKIELLDIGSHSFLY